jgi:hypothetical protein
MFDKLSDYQLFKEYPAPWSKYVSQEFPPFMEPEGLLPYSPQPTTGPYPEPDESNSHISTLFP